MSKSRNYYASIKRSRDEWKNSLPQKCMWCGMSGFMEIHEIERRSHAHNKWWPESGCNGLLLDGECHAGPFAAMPHVRQSAVKLLRDPERFDLNEWLSVGGRLSSYVTLREVVEEAATLFSKNDNLNLVSKAVLRNSNVHRNSGVNV